MGLEGVPADPLVTLCAGDLGKLAFLEVGWTRLQRTDPTSIGRSRPSSEGRDGTYGSRVMGDTTRWFAGGGVRVGGGGGREGRSPRALGVELPRVGQPCDECGLEAVLVEPAGCQRSPQPQNGQRPRGLEPAALRRGGDLVAVVAAAEPELADHVAAPRVGQGWAGKCGEQLATPTRRRS